MGNLLAKLKRIKFSYTPAKAGRIHYLNPDDVVVLLSRLPEALWQRLRAVHFNDDSVGRRRAGYVNWGHREIAICAFPAVVSCTPFTASRRRNRSPSTFGASRGRQWPQLAVRRYLLYDTFLHELGHLQIVDADAKSLRRRFASETLAQDFANQWRRVLWSEHFDHPDPVHNPPAAEEPHGVVLPTRSRDKVLHARYRTMAARAALDKAKVFQRIEDFAAAVAAYDEALDFAPQLAVAYAQRGNALSRSGKTALAQADFARPRELGYEDQGALRPPGPVRLCCASA
jgi:hypothetical protein